MLLQAANGAVFRRPRRSGSISLPSCRSSFELWPAQQAGSPRPSSTFGRRAPGHHDHLGFGPPWWRTGANGRGLAWRRLRGAADEPQGARFGIHRRRPPRFSAVRRPRVFAGPGAAGCPHGPELPALAVEVESHLELRDRAPSLQFWFPQLHDTLDALIAVTMMLVFGLHLHGQSALRGRADRSRGIQLLGVNETWQKRQQGQEQEFPRGSTHGPVPAAFRALIRQERRPEDHGRARDGRQ